MGTKLFANLQKPTSHGDIQALSRQLAGDKEGFNQLSILLGHLAGVRLTHVDKDYALMANRIAPILVAHGIKDYKTYIKYIGQGNPKVIEEFVSVMTTHTTQFFREEVQIQHFIDLLPGYLKAKKDAFDLELRVWCAACSTGQEAYTLALILHDVIPNIQSWRIKFLATDIDVTALGRASRGQYSKAEIVSLPEKYQKKFLQPVLGTRGEQFQIAPDVVSHIRFAPLNLLDREYPFQHRFDFVFCRNVLYYFGQFDSETIVNKIEKVLSPKGYLYVGANESAYVKNSHLSRIGPAAYIKK